MLLVWRPPTRNSCIYFTCICVLRAIACTLQICIVCTCCIVISDFVGFALRGTINRLTIKYSKLQIWQTYIQLVHDVGCRCTLNGVTFTYLQQKYEPRCTLNGVTFTYLQQKYKPLILDNVVRAPSTIANNLLRFQNSLTSIKVYLVRV